MPEFDTLGRALRWIREENNLKQLQVAEAAGITRPMLSAYERGKVKPTLETLERILQALGCDLMDLTRALRIVTPTRPPQELLGTLDLRGEEGEGALEGFSPTGAAEERAFRELITAIHRWLQALRKAAVGRPSE